MIRRIPKHILAFLGILFPYAASATGREMAGLAEGIMLLLGAGVLAVILFFAYIVTVSFRAARREQQSILKSLLTAIATGLVLTSAAILVIFLWMH
jgi:hypothetical protein